MLSTPYIDKVKAKISSPVLLNIFWLSFDKLFKLIIGLAVGVWVARYLGPSQWGELNYVVAIISIITTISNLGMDGFLIKEILGRPLQKAEILGTAFFMRSVVVPICCLVVVMYFQLFKSETPFLPLFLLLSLNAIAVPFDLIDIEFQSMLKSRLTVTSKNIAYILGALAKVALILNNKSLFWFAGVMGLETLLAYFFLTFNYQRFSNIFDWKFNKALAKDFIKAGWPFTLTNLAVILYMRIDQIMLQNMSGSYELGLFSSSAKITEMFTFIPMAIASSFLPSLIKAKNESHGNFLKSIQFYLNWMTKLSLAIALIVSLLSSIIISTLYGEKFSAASGILVLHVWAVVPMFLGVASANYLVLEDLQKYSLYKTILGLIINIVLNLVLIPSYGAYGAAVSTLVSYFISAIFSNIFFASTKTLFTLQLKSILFLLKFDR